MKDNEFLWAIVIIVLSLLILFGVSSYLDYKIARMELTQPKYFLEFNEELYELQKVN